jgi:hypothetical protein
MNLPVAEKKMGPLRFPLYTGYFSVLGTYRNTPFSVIVRRILSNIITAIAAICNK